MQNNREFLNLVILLYLLIMLLINECKSEPTSGQLLFLRQLKHSSFDVFENELILLPNQNH